MDPTGTKPERPQRAPELVAETIAHEPAALDPEMRACIRLVEQLPCNRTGQDKSWVLRAEESRRRFFREARRAEWR